MSDSDQLLSSQQAAPMFGYEPVQHRAVRLFLLRCGIEPWRNPMGRGIRWWKSDLLALQRKGVARPAQRVEQPESSPVAAHRFRKPAA